MSILEETVIAEMRKDSMLIQETSDETILIALKGLKRVYGLFCNMQFDRGSFDPIFFDSIEALSAATVTVVVSLYGMNASVGITEFLNENSVNDQPRGVFLARILDKLPVA